ncbi:MAG: hypothetical protein ACKO56_01105 [Paracoccaceae bacterium]
MRFLRAAFLVLGFGFGLSACQTNDLTEPPVPLGDFALGHNIVVTSNMQKVPISRDATPEQWEAALEKAMEERFGRYEGEKLYNIGISIDAFALAPPGVPLVLNPKSALGITVTIWDDAAQKKLNEEGKQIIVMEKMSGETVLGSGLTQSAAKQMEILSYNAAKAVEGWLLENPEWFGLPPLATAPTPTVTTFNATPPAVPTAAAPVPAVTE